MRRSRPRVRRTKEGKWIGTSIWKLGRGARGGASIAGCRRRLSECRSFSTTSLPGNMAAARLSNLALCRGRCNLHKGPNIASIDPQTGHLSRPFNPRIDVWTQHFRWEHATVKGLTEIGRASTTSSSARGRSSFEVFGADINGPLFELATLVQFPCLRSPQKSLP